jgi:hypothetical protein
VAVLGEDPRQLRADAGRRAGNQRDRLHAPPGSPASFAIR